MNFGQLKPQITTWIALSDVPTMLSPLASRRDVRVMAQGSHHIRFALVWFVCCAC